MHLTRFLAELWRRVRLEVIIEVRQFWWHLWQFIFWRSHHQSFGMLQLPLLKSRWKTIVFGLIMQYVHGIFTQLAHRMHQPQDEPLHDVGFDLTPVRVMLSFLTLSAPRH